MLVGRFPLRKSMEPLESFIVQTSFDFGTFATIATQTLRNINGMVSQNGNRISFMTILKKNNLAENVVDSCVREYSLHKDVFSNVKLGETFPLLLLRIDRVKLLMYFGIVWKRTLISSLLGYGALVDLCL